MLMQWNNRLTPERYLANKEYFDQGLIDTLIHQQEKIEKLEFRISLYEAITKKYEHKITTLVHKTKDMEIKLYNLAKKNKAGNEEVEELRNDLKDVNNILNSVVKDKDKTIAELLEIIHDLNETVKDYQRKERKQQLSDTTNTNNPTSTYRFGDAEKSEDKKKEKKKKPCNLREKTERKRGGQPGHKSSRATVSDKCDHVFEVHVKSVPSGAQPVYDEYGNVRYYCVQVKDARLVTVTDEYHFVLDPNGISLHADTMKRFRINPVVYSNQLKAQVLYLKSKGVVSLGRLCKILNEMSMGELNITESTVVNWMKEFDVRSEDFLSYVLEQILRAWVVHVDETGYRINGKLSWLHVLCTDQFSYYVMTEKRKDVEKGPLKLLENFTNILLHDHFKAYYDLNCDHAECGAHILRSLKAGVDFDEVLECEKMITFLNKALSRRYELIDSGKTEMPESEYEEYRKEYIEIIDNTLTKYEAKYKDVPAKYVPDALKTLRRMKEYANEHLLFLKDFDVPFTNNAAERQARAAKAHKKISGQCYSIETSKYLTTLLTVIQTASLQGINTLNLMNELMNNRWVPPTKN